ncbi:MAG: NAD(P)H-binding protein [Bryobacteraceae bacterium]
MRVILFGATGMVGQGVLRECLLDPDVEAVLSLVRTPTALNPAKLREVVQQDVSDLSAIEDDLGGYDACFFCLGVSSLGMAEPEYRRVTHDLTLSVARTLARQNPAMTFIYVSGTGTDSSGRGRSMWARVKGETENDLLRLPFQAAYMFRPGFIWPLHGAAAKTKWLRCMYAVVGPFYPLLRALAPKYATTTECVGRAMIRVVRHGAPRHVLENRDINAACRD